LGAVEAAAPGGTVHGAAGLLRGDVADALRRPALLLPAGLLQRIDGPGLLPAVLPRPPRNRVAGVMRRRDFLALSTAALLPRPPFRPEPRLVERWSWAMGQPVHLRLFHSDEARGLEAAQAALAELRRVEGVLSRFDEGSALSELHRRAGQGWFGGPPELAAVLAAAPPGRSATGGAFDVTIEPLMRAWGFREPRKAPPGERELSEATAAVAAAVIELDGPRIRLPARHTRLDLGGIGVGYGIDRAGVVLGAH